MIETLLIECIIVVIYISYYLYNKNIEVNNYINDLYSQINTLNENILLLNDQINKDEEEVIEKKKIGYKKN